MYHSYLILCFSLRNTCYLLQRCTLSLSLSLSLARARALGFWVAQRMGVLCVLVVVSMALLGRGEESSWELTRDDFPRDFVFGAGTSAYQVEGAAAEDGRAPSIWDTFAHAGRVPGKETGDMAADEYHKYKEDVRLMKETGLEGYRFSISWSRLIPNGKGEVNPKGLEYYNNLINELINHGIELHVTLFHYDLPQVLEDEYEGWLSPRIVDDFTAYADVCFREFGDRVRYWTTLNEPNVFILASYDVGLFPPGRCSSPFGSNCPHGNSILEPYIVAHNCLLAHSSAVSLYRRKYQAEQDGSIGLNVFIYNFVPLTNSTKDILATKRAQDFYTGCFLDPVTRGDYPKIIRKYAGSKVPNFSEEQSKQLIGSFDFIGVNYYGTLFVADDPSDKPTQQRDYMGDMLVKVTGQGGTMIGSQNITSGHGLQAVLEYITQVYGNPPTYIHENGYSMELQTFNDTARVKYLSVHLRSLLDALRNGSNTRGYFVWSFLDLFELFDGYQHTYGLYYVDFDNEDRKRYPKLSAYWYSNFLKKIGIANQSYHNTSNIAVL